MPNYAEYSTASEVTSISRAKSQRTLRVRSTAARSSGGFTPLPLKLPLPLMIATTTYRTNTGLPPVSWKTELRARTSISCHVNLPDKRVPRQVPALTQREPTQRPTHIGNTTKHLEAPCRTEPQENRKQANKTLGIHITNGRHAPFSPSPEGTRHGHGTVTPGRASGTARGAVVACLAEAAIVVPRRRREAPATVTFPLPLPLPLPPFTRQRHHQGGAKSENDPEIRRRSTRACP